MQDRKFSYINQKIKEREKVAELISKSFINEKEKSKEKYVMKIENQSFFDVSKDHAYSKAKKNNNNFESNNTKRDLSLIDTGSKRVDQYYNKYVE